jgi:hypothetical protein
MEGYYRCCLVRLPSTLLTSLMVLHTLLRAVRIEEKLMNRDKIAAGLRTKLDFNFTLPQVLESATWKCGRLIAAEKRKNGGPPIEIESDGTIF